MHIPVLQTSVSLADFPAGQYRITAELTDGAYPTCGEKALTVSSRAALPETAAAVYCAGVSAPVQSLLQAQGAQVSAYTGGDAGGFGDSAGQRMQRQRVADGGLPARRRGAHLILLDAAGFDSLPVQGEIQDSYAALVHKTA